MEPGREQQGCGVGVGAQLEERLLFPQLLPDYSSLRWPQGMVRSRNHEARPSGFKVPLLSLPQFPHLKNGDDGSAYHIGLS